ncbi:MAG: hypothetical protein HYX20_02025 [Candidatus Yanofskybacteria bacterium]|nr:hypothetical protein [Candidatus Yanofskybacteria bacterium]
MTTVIIPQNIGKTKELVAVPRDIYEEFLEWHKQTKMAKTLKLTKSQKQALARARSNFAKGKYLTWEEVKHGLESNN